MPPSLPSGITLELIFVLQSVFLGDKIKEKNQRQSRHYELRQAALARPPKMPASSASIFTAFDVILAHHNPIPGILVLGRVVQSWVKITQG